MRLIDADALLQYQTEADKMGAMLVVGKGFIMDAPTITPQPDPDTGLVPCGCGGKSKVAHEEQKEADKESAYRFYYCDTEDSYLIGHRVDTLYYARWHKGLGFVFEMSRYLPWGETVNGHEHGNDCGIYTYPSEPREIGICEWFKGFLTQQAEGDPANDHARHRGLHRV